jgi:hypothetical protein
MITKITSKQDLIRALGQRELTFIGEYEAVNDNGLKIATEKAKTLIRQKKKLHVVLIERD